MSKYHEAADVLRREAQRYEALMLAAKALDEIGSLDQAADEAKTRLQTYTDAAQSANATMDKIVAATEIARLSYEANREIALKDTATIKAEALAESTKIIADAKTEGVRINQIATDSAKATTAQAEKRCNDLADKCRVLAEELAMREKAIAESNAEAAAAEDRLANIKAAIAKYAE